MTDERLAEIKNHLEEVEIWRSAGEASLVIEGGYARAFLPECVAEIDRLRERIEQLEYMEARSAAEARAERERAEFWKAECAARAWLLKDREQAGHDYKCPECFEFPHLADCDLARLMTMPEEPKP